MPVVVTGALGHIGSALIRDEGFLSLDTDFLLVDDLSTSRYVSLFDLPSGRFHLVEGAVDAVLTPELISGAQALVHLAAIADPGLSAREPEFVFQHNLRNTEHAVRTCHAAGVPIVFPSSTSIYGGTSLQTPEFGGSIDPSTPYAACKLAEEEVLLSTFADGLPGIILRFATIFGTSPGMRFHTAINKFCWQACVGEPISVYETALHQYRPYLYVGDAVAGLTQSIRAGHFDGRVLNLSSCTATVDEALTAIRTHVSDAAITTVASSVMNKHSFGVSTQTAQDLGFTFRGSLSDGIAETMALLSGLRR
jgi:UDP-glucose 4-epimerase